MVSESHPVRLQWSMKAILSIYHGQWDPSCLFAVVNESRLVHLPWSVRAICPFIMVNKSHLVHLPWSTSAILSTYRGQREPFCPLTLVNESHRVHLPWSVRATLSIYRGQWEPSCPRGGPIGVLSHHLSLITCPSERLNWLSSGIHFSSSLVM